MDKLTHVMEQAQSAMLSARSDISTIQIRSIKDRVKGEPPFQLAVQEDIQCKQEAAADLLQSGISILYESLCELDEKAQRLGNVNRKEKELHSTKKCMKRYFDAHNKLLEEQKDYYEDVLRLEGMKHQNMSDTVVDVCERTRRRQVLHQALGLWYRRSVARRAAREQDCTRTRLLESRDQAGEHVASLHRETSSKRKLFYLWQRKWHAARDERLQKEVTELERQASYFQAQAVDTQRLLSTYISDEHTKTHALHGTKQKECELLDSEVDRLKMALDDVTSEFSDRTKTYLRQQQETEHFFRTKEEKLKNAVIQLQSDVERCRVEKHQALLEIDSYVSITANHFSALEGAFSSSMAQKESFIFATFQGVVERLMEKNKLQRAESSALRDDLNLLSPLSEKVLRLDNELSKVASRLKQTRVENENLREKIQEEQSVATLLTDRVAASTYHCTRQRIFHDWLSFTEHKKRVAAQSEKEALKQTLLERQKDFLVQQQASASAHREEVARLQADLERKDHACRQLQKELSLWKAQVDEKEATNCKLQIEVNDLVAVVASRKADVRTISQQLADASLQNLLLDEENGRLFVERQEQLWLEALRQKEMDMLRQWGETTAKDSAQLTEVCNDWHRHCEGQETHARERRKKMQHAVAAHMNEQARLRQSARWFTEWRVWAAARSAERKGEEQQAATTLCAEAKLTQALETHWQERLVSQERRAQEVLLQMRAQHVAEKEEANKVHKAAMQQLGAQCRQRTLEKEEVEAAHEAAVQKMKLQLQQLTSEKEESKTAHQASLRNIETQLRQQISDLQESYELQVTQQKAAMKKMQETYEKELQSAKEDWRTEKQALREEYIAKLERQQASCDRLAEEKHQGDAERETLNTTALETNAKIGDLASQLVEYCASATLFKWRTWAAERKLQRRTRENKDNLTLRFTHVVSAHNLLLDTYRRRQQELYTSALAHLLFTAQHSSNERLETMEARNKKLESLLTKSESARAEALSTTAIWQEEAEQWKQMCAQEQTRANNAADQHAHDMRQVEELQKYTDAFYETTLELTTSHADHSMDIFADAAQQWATTNAASLSQAKAVDADMEQRLGDILCATQDAVRGGDVLQGLSEEALLNHMNQSFLVDDNSKATETRRSAEAVRQAALVLLERQKQQDEQLLAEAVEKERNALQEKIEHLEASLQKAKMEQTEASASHLEELQAQEEKFTQLTSTRLDEIVSHYKRVLDAYCNSINERRETFYSVNGILVEVDIFSADLMRRFEANVAEMELIRNKLATTTTPKRKHSTLQKEYTPFSMKPMDESLVSASSRSSDSPLTVDQILTEMENRALGEISPGRQALRDRVGMLERMLVETKTQLALAKELADNSMTLSLPHNTADPSVLEKWSDQAARDVHDLDLPFTFDEMLMFYAQYEEKVKHMMDSYRQLQGAQDKAAALEVKLASFQEEATKRAERQYTEKIKRLEKSVAGLHEQLDRKNHIFETERAELNTAIAQLRDAADHADEKTRAVVDQVKEKYSVQLQHVNEENDRLQTHIQALEREMKDAKPAAAWEEERQTLEKNFRRYAEVLIEEKEQLETENTKLTEEKMQLEEKYAFEKLEAQRTTQQLLAAHNHEMEDIKCRYEELKKSSASTKAIDNSMAYAVNRKMDVIRLLYDRHLDVMTKYVVDSFQAVASATLAEAQRAVESAAARDGADKGNGDEKDGEAHHALPSQPIPTKSLSVEGVSPIRTVYKLPPSPSSGAFAADSTQMMTTSISPRYENETPATADAPSQTVHDVHSNTSVEYRQLESSRLHGSSSYAKRHRSLSSPRPTWGGHVTTPFTTPIRTRSASIESLEVSQSMLRYSKLLNLQIEKNTERYYQADALTSDLDELIARGKKIEELARQEQLLHRGIFSN